jgi:4-amino-4-deoxy-L-arabinose transferase-like glycosyltransferase
LTVEISFACMIAFAVALVQATRRTIVITGQLYGPLQIAASLVCAALVPTLLAYSVQFHTAWALGIDDNAALIQTINAHGMEASLLSALLLDIAGATTYFVAALFQREGRRLLGLLPAALALLLVLVMMVRGSVGGRFRGDELPPALVSTIIVFIFLVAAIIGVSRVDSTVER